MNPHPGRILQAMRRIQEVLVAEFDDLQPPDLIMIFQWLSWTYLEKANSMIFKDRP